jgi:acyl carrier protein
VNDIAQMTDDELKTRLLELLVEVAPDVEPHTVQQNCDFREQFDFDSMDLFNYAATIHRTFGVDIAEKDYRRLLSIEKAATYLRGSPAGR